MTGVALVTGGSRGIGRAVAISLAADHPVAITYRRDERAAADVVDAIAGSGGVAVAVQGDLTEPGAAARVVSEAQDRLGPLEVLVGNAGAASRGRSAVDSTNDEYMRMFQLFTVANLELARAAMPSLRQLRGRVVYVSSVVTSLLPAGTAPYAAGKAALDAAVAVMAREERDHGVRVNLVAPGLVATDMGDRLTSATSGESAAADLDRHSPLGRVCRPEDVAAAVAFLCDSTGSAYITGHRLVVDGGGPNNSLVPLGT